MNSFDKISSVNSGFLTLVNRTELEFVTGTLSDDTYRAQALRYYGGAVAAPGFSEQLAAVRLLEELVESQTRSSSGARVVQLRENLTRYHRQLSTTVDFLSPGKPVPRKLHFVWVGGGIGAIQGDYINVWKQLTSPDGYGLNLWYDGDGLLAHETNRIILESAKAQSAAIFKKGSVDKASTLGNLYVERAYVLHRQMFEHIQKAIAQGVSADQARIDLLVGAYGQDETKLQALKERNLKSIENIGANGISLRDIRAELSGQPLFDIYERELSFRGNLAAASDITRLQALDVEGGTYLDADLLPSLHNNIAGMDLSREGVAVRSGVMQVLLDPNPQILPNRRMDYADSRDRVPEQHKDALTDFARKVTSVQDMFASFKEVVVSQNGIRVGNKNPAHSDNKPFNGLSNAMLSCHPGSAAITGIFEKIRNNYAFRDRMRALAWQNQISLTDIGEFSDLIRTEMEKDYGPVMQWDSHSSARPQLLTAVATYDGDGIKFGAESAIAMSGPTAVSQGLDDFVNVHAVDDARQQISDRVDLRDGFNLATEEETHHSWKDDAKSDEQWFDLEKARITDSTYKDHYRGNVEELLGQSLTFKRGWPVIEGKPVLLTSVLQQLLDDLGEPFIRAMNDRLTGDIRFDPSLLDFKTRQQILTQPASEIPRSIGSESLGNLNEALARIAAGKLPIDQLSPLHRVVIGGLFGATSLDQEGFTAVWDITVALAENTRDRGLGARYDVIEQILLDRVPASFESSLHVTSTDGLVLQSSHALKAQAFAQVMTVRQWREHIRQTGVVARNEYRASLLTRGVAVRQAFVAAGACAARQLPQGLLVHGMGEPGRRCYPLALAMAAALETGVLAERSLIGQMALADRSPDSPETHALLNVLDELRGIPMAQFGEKGSTANIATVMQTLEAKTVTGSLMLNTDSHSMLISKIIGLGDPTYRFYDPNFGVFEFNRLEYLQKGVQVFLQDEVIARLYGLGDVSTLTFDLLDLNGSKIATKDLPSKLTVGDLLNGEPLAGGRTVDPWQQHGKLRLRALAENARLGQAISLVETQKWTRVIESSTRRLQEQHQLTHDFVPIFESLKTATGGMSEITLVNSKEPNQTRTVITDDKRLSGIKTYLDQSFEGFSARRPGSTHVDPTDVGSVHTLNAGFAIQSLLLSLRTIESAEGSTAMTAAVRLHGYLAYAQLAHGLAVDAVQLLGLVRHAFTDNLRVANTTTAIVGNALGNVLNEGVGNLLQLAGIGFDIYLLTNAENDSQRAVYATQLAFDSAGLVLGVGALGAGTAGAATAAAFLGGASVILGGLAVGIGALVEGFSGRKERALQIGRYLNNVHEAYRVDGYSMKCDTFYSSPYAVYSRLDLRKGVITFGSQKIFAAENYSALHVPRINGDREKAFSIREALNLPAEMAIKDVRHIESIILPSLPECYLGYEFGGLPFSTTLREELQTALALEYDQEGNRQFWFTFYRMPTEYIIEQFIPNYAPTTISVVLGRSHRFLHVPSLPQEVQGYLSYDIEGMGGHCTITVSGGVNSIKLTNDSNAENMSWTLLADWVYKHEVKIKDDQLQLGLIKVHVPDKSVVYLQVEGHSYQIGWACGTLLLLELQADPKGEDLATRSKLLELAGTHSLADGYTTVRNYLDPLTGVRTAAWYDRVQDLFLLVRGLDPKFAADLCLGARIGGDTYYYCPSEVLIWRTDTVTGQIKRIYRLKKSELKAWISSFRETPEGQLQVVWRIEKSEYEFIEMTYLIDEDELSLMSVYGLLPPHFGRSIRAGFFDIEGFDSWYRLIEPDLSLPGLNAGPVVDAQYSAMMTCDYMDYWLKKFARVWVRSDDGRVVRPKLKSADADADYLDWVLLDPQQPVGDTLLFRYLDHRLLYRQHITEQLSSFWPYAKCIFPLEVMQVHSRDRQHVVLTEEGMLFQLNELDESHLIGLSSTWLMNRQARSGVGFRWWTTVAETAGNWSSEGLEVAGIKSAASNGSLYVVCVDEQFIIADAAAKDIRLLRQTADKKAGWLLDFSSGRIYRQACMAEDALYTAFGAGTRLLQADLIPTMQRVMPKHTFAWAVPHESGLRAQTHSHVLFDLFEGEPPRVVGVGDAFFSEMESREVREKKLGQLLIDEHSAPYLPVGSIGDLYTWYDVASGRLLSATAPENGSRPDYLGARGETMLLHDPLNQRLFSNRENSDEGLIDEWMRVEGASRIANTLAIETGDSSGEIPPIPDGVDTLVLGLARDGAYSVSQKTWAQLDCLIVDLDFPEPVKSNLRFQVGPMSSWLVTRDSDHLLLTEPDSGRSIILRNAGRVDMTSGQNVGFSISFSEEVQVTLYLDELLAALEGQAMVALGSLFTVASPD